MTPVLLVALWLAAADRTVDATFLYRHLPSLGFRPAEFTTAACRYRPVFGAGDAQARLLRGVARFGELEIDAGGACAEVAFASEEQVLIMIDGRGALQQAGERISVAQDDYWYLAPGVKSAVSCASEGRCRVLVMGFRVPPQVPAPAPARLPLANMKDVPKQVVGGHPPSTLYQLLMGDTRSRRDKLACAGVLTSLFTMEFAPGGTNFPHHHEREEEIYLVLEGHGEMVAGGGVDGIENRRPARAGDAYFFRLNTTVGFYAGNREGEPKSRILAVRSLFPFAR